MEFCCLGVAHVIGLCKPHERHDDAFVSNDFLEDSIQEKLANFNDGKDKNGVSTKPKSFKWIASYIERYL